jgi:CheY-like chemotaxis protein
MAGVTTDSVRVLIVDDKPDIRAVVASRLQIEPTFEVVGEAANGAEAIARVGELQPQVMILDLQMPVMSGEEVIPILRSLSPHLRIMVFSAYAGTGQRLSASELPDAEVRKGSGLTPLVRELHRLVEAPPADLVAVDLGQVDVDSAHRASHAWSRLNPTVRQAAMDEGMRCEFLALVGVFLALGEPIHLARRSHWLESTLCFATRLEAGRAARRALAAIQKTEAAALEPLRTRLLAALPA